MEKRKVYTYEHRVGHKLMGSLVTPHLKSVIDMYNRVMAESIALGCYLEQHCEDISKWVKGQRVVQSLSVTSKDGSHSTYTIFVSEA